MTARLRTRARFVVRLSPIEDIPVRCGAYLSTASGTVDAKRFDKMPKPTGLKGIPFFGMHFQLYPFSEFRINKMVDLRRHCLAEYGKIYRENLGPMWMVHLFDPADVATLFQHEGKYPSRGFQGIDGVYQQRSKIPKFLALMEGSEWQEMRRAVQVRFLQPKAASHFLTVQNRVADDFLMRISAILDEDSCLPNLKEELFKYTAESVGTVCFNRRLGCLDDNLHPGSDAQVILDNLDIYFKIVMKSTFTFPWYMYFRTPMYRRFAEASDKLFGIGLKYINTALEEAKQSQQPEVRGEPDLIRSLLVDGKMTPDYVTSMALSLFIAGIESAGLSLGFILHNMAKNPRCQEKLVQEINHFLPGKSLVDEDSLGQMSYLKACVKESFRLVYPLPGGAPRLIPEDIVLGGYHVPKGSLILPEQAVMTRMEEYFERPDEFIPERWVREEKRQYRQSALASFIVLPFGHGVRNCLGRRFAEQELYLALVKILQRFQLDDNTPGEVGFVSNVFTAPDRPLKIRFTERK